MVQKVSTTFPEKPGTIENTSYNSETKTYTTTSESTYNGLVIPSNVIFNVEHDIQAQSVGAKPGNITPGMSAIIDVMYEDIDHRKCMFKRK